MKIVKTMLRKTSVEKMLKARKYGFYWVKIKNKEGWTIGQWTAICRWFLVGDMYGRSDDFLDEVGEKIDMPEDEEKENHDQ